MKKGFTVVELLAIIIILAVISLITYSVVQRNIDITKTSSFEISVKHVIEAAKEYVVTNYEENDFPEGGIDITNNELDIKNSEFISGVILKDENGVIRVVNLTDGKMCANGTKNDLEITPGSCEAADKTPPTLEVKVIKKTSSKVRFLIKMQDAQSGLSNLTYCSGSCNDVETLELPNKRSMVKKVIEIPNLEAGKKYKFKFTVKNNLESDNEEMTTTTIEKEVELPEVEEPIFKISSGSHATTKHVKIIYPELSEYEYSYYTKNNPENITVLESEKYEADFDISENTEITARISKDGNIVIESSLTVAGLDLEPPTTYVYIENRNIWTKEKNVYVKSVDDSSGLALRGYSLNNKKSWVKADSNGVVTTLKANQKFTLKTRDKVGNINENFRLCEDRNFENCGNEIGEYQIQNIDNVAPKIELNVIRKANDKTSESNLWYISNTVTIQVKIYDQAPKIVNGETQIIRDGIGINKYSPTITLNGQTISHNNNRNGTGEFITTFDVTKNGTNEIYVSMEDDLNNTSEERLTIKKDDVTPTITAATNFTGTVEATSVFVPNYGVSGIDPSMPFTCNPETLSMNSRTATCTFKDGAGRVANASATATYYYTATPYRCNCHEVLHEGRCYCSYPSCCYDPHHPNCYNCTIYSCCDDDHYVTECSTCYKCPNGGTRSGTTCYIS